MTRTPTSEQVAILDAVTSRSESIMVNAYAGTGKSTTLEMICKQLPVNARVLALVFNVKNKKDLEAKLPKHIQVKTLNGLGHNAWSNSCAKTPRIADRKIGSIVTTVCKANGFAANEEDWDQIRRLATAAQHAGIVPSTFPIHAKNALVPDDPINWMDLAEREFWAKPDKMIIELARATLIENVKQAFAGIISYDDQIYCSALLNARFTQYDIVLGDEVQDWSPLNHIQVAKACPTGRLILVGDRKQSIYAFRGADSNSMDNAKGLRRNWIELPLATTFRCPQAIVARQQAHAEGFRAAPTAPMGEVHKWLNKDGATPWTADTIRALGYDVAVLCRNNAPLLGLAFKLLARRVPVAMLGRDIGKNLTALAKKILSNEMAIADAIAAVAEWKDSQIALAEANNKPASAIESIEDRADCLLAVLGAEGVASVADALDLLHRLLSRENAPVVLSSGHRAKGLEWDTVIHLDSWRIPSRYATTLLAKQQEENLKYVIETRTKRVFIEANLDDFA